MVQIKKKVTLKAKTEQESVVETQQQPIPAPDGNATGGNGGKKKVVGGLVVLAVVGLLGYGAYSLLTHSDDKNSDTITEQVEGAATSNEGDTKDVPNEETAGTPDAENANDSATNDENTTVPSQDKPSSEAAAPQSESTQDASVKPAEPTKQATRSNEIAKQTVPPSRSVTLSGTLEEKAKDVIRGNYGNGAVRKQKLGDQYDEIQSKVNEMYRNGLVK